MHYIRHILTLLIFISVGVGAPAAEYHGSWTNPHSGARIDILDGFKPGRGPVLSVDEDNKVKAGSWEEDNGVISVKIGFQKYTLIPKTAAQIALKPNYGDEFIFERLVTDASTATVSLKDDSAAFITKLQSKIWITSLEGQFGVFKPTFANDAGVLELANGKQLTDLRSWAVASGVLKINRDVIIEARVNDGFFVGLDKRDRFIVFRAFENAQGLASTNLESEREAFFNKLLTGEWISTGYGVSTVRFRPVFGELAGKVLSTRKGRLNSQSNWEYSPSTGALKVGHTKYKGALIVNNTLALLENDGDQVFYNRSRNSSEKRYTLADLKQTALNENSLTKIQEMLGLQSYKGEYLFSWEFNADGRSGYLHKWKSEPFTITGETLDQEGVGKRNTLRQVEDFLIFDDDEVYQLDTTVSRLRPKSDAEALADSKAAGAAKASALSKQLTLRITSRNGEILNLPIPLSDFSKIANMSIVSE